MLLRQWDHSSRYGHFAIHSVGKSHKKVTYHNIMSVRIVKVSEMIMEWLHLWYLVNEFAEMWSNSGRNIDLNAKEIDGQTAFWLLSDMDTNMLSKLEHFWSFFRHYVTCPKPASQLHISIVLAVASFWPHLRFSLLCICQTFWTLVVKKAVATT